MVKNPPANAGDMGSSPGLGRSHMPRSNSAHVPQLLSLHPRAPEPQLLSPRATTTEARMPRARAPQQEKPPQWEACALQRRIAPALHNQRKAACSNEGPMQPKINKLKNKIKWYIQNIMLPTCNYYKNDWDILTFFHTRSSKSAVYVILTAHLSSS